MVIELRKEVENFYLFFVAVESSKCQPKMRAILVKALDKTHDTCLTPINSFNFPSE